ncbi:hypothetical protein SVA_2870 [Sulfurifustis variabilis]|uniref:Uncharacterized protein n=1 Tax=Sulfurifustis variabilis TaxID=1675686 RepID=A0A1B4V7D2_9GAMM|nr:hypothetical protein [Sulfurifustis variabilis]BAU49418.1 hypothetical protein SVA_2870 [Sulfurifustis variabilis]
MAITFHTITNTTTYRDLVYNTLKSSGYEGTVYWAYADSKGIPTIGIGFNLRDPAVFDEVIKVLGPNPFASGLTPTQKPGQRAKSANIGR